MYQLLLPDLRLMLSENDEQGMKEFCEALFPAVSAEILIEVSPEEAWRVLSKCSLARLVEIFEYFTLPFQIELVDLMDRECLSRLIEEMAPDDRVDLLERLDPNHVESILPLVAQAERTDIRKLLSYPEDSAGSIMTTEYASLPKDITVKEAFERLRLQAPDRETIYYIYIIDEHRHLIGFLTMRKLILARPDQKLSEIMARDIISVRVDEDQEKVARDIDKYGFLAIPVVDNTNRLVGIVTHDDATDILEDEAEEDQQRLAAVEPLEDSYLSTPLLTLSKKRGVWLFFLLGASVLTAWVLQYFEAGDTNNWVIMFLPLVLASGGNAGSQSAALVISALAREHFSLKGGSALKIIYRELFLSTLLGGTVGLVSFGAAWLLTDAIEPAIVVSSTVLLVVVMASVAGAALPIIVHSFHVDPAYMSTPLIAALVDVAGVIIYFNVAFLVYGSYPPFAI